MQFDITVANCQVYKERTGWIDVWKGLLIFQIVVFHALGVANEYVNNSSSVLVNGLSSFIESYHVTAFFTITGMLWRGKRDFRLFIVKKSFRLLVPYLIFGLFWAILYVLFSQIISGKADGSTTIWKPLASVLLCNGWPKGEGWRVVNALWFLPCMFLTSITYWFIDRVLPKFWWQVVVLLVLNGFEHRAVDLLPWAAERVPRMLIFMLIGRWTGNIFNVQSRYLCFILSFLIYAVSSYRPIVQYLCNWGGLGAWRFVVQSFLPIIASGFLACSIANSRFLEALGKYSLVILSLHKLPILLLQALPPVMTVIYGNVAWPVSLVCVSTISVGLSLFGALLLHKYCPIVIGEWRRT